MPCHAGGAKTQTFELPVRIDGQGQTTLDWRMQPAAPLVARAAMRIQAGEEVIGSRAFVFVYGAESYQWHQPAPEEKTDRVWLVLKLYRDGLYRSGLDLVNLAVGFNPR